MGRPLHPNTIVALALLWLVAVVGFFYALWVAIGCFVVAVLVVGLD